MKTNGPFLAWVFLLITSMFSAPETAGQAAPNGQALFQGHCAVCHNDAATGANRAPSPAVLAGKTQEEILRALESGAMVIYGNRITEAERKAIAAFLSSNPGNSGTEAAANLCSARRPLTESGVNDRENWNGWGVDIVNS